MYREKWSSGIGFILARIGSAVGAGNIWRFLCITDENGGGRSMQGLFILGVIRLG